MRLRNSYISGAPDAKHKETQGAGAGNVQMQRFRYLALSGNGGDR